MFTAFACGLGEQVAFSFLPVYAVGAGVSAETGALWLSVFVMGNVVLQWPIGWLADHFDRRIVLAGCTLVSAVLVALLPMVPATSPGVIGVVMLWGGISFAIYPVGLALLGQRFRGGDIARANTAFSLIYILGGLLGRPAAGAAMDAFGDPGLGWHAGARLCRGGDRSVCRLAASRDGMNAAAPWRRLLPVYLSCLGYGVQAGAAMPLVPLALEHRGVGNVTIGLVEAVWGIGMIATAHRIPAVAARLGAVKLVCASLGLSAILLVAFAYTDSLPLWFVLSFLLGMVGGVPWVVSEIWINLVADEGSRGRAVAIYAALMAGRHGDGPARAAGRRSLWAAAVPRLRCVRGAGRAAAVAATGTRRRPSGRSSRAASPA